MAKQKAASVCAKPCDTSRNRRRASQTRHRRKVASCYQRLRKCIPLGIRKSQQRCRKKSYLGKRRVLNKVAVLNQSKEYILHLENVLQELLGKQKTTLQECMDFDNMVARTIRNFQTIDAFRRHFGTRFDPHCDISSYFDGTTDVMKLRKMPNCLSSQQSEDLGFVSGEGNSQERCSTSSSLRHNQDANHAFERGVCSYPTRSTLPHNHNHSYHQDMYPHPTYFNGSHLIYYVPAVGYPASFPYYAPSKNNVPVCSEQQSSRDQVTEPHAQSNLPVCMPGKTMSRCQSQAVLMTEQCISNSAQAQASRTTTSMPKLKMRYSYSKPGGKMSAPKIYVPGQNVDSGSPPTLFLVKKGERDDGNGEYYSSCLLPNC